MVRNRDSVPHIRTQYSIPERLSVPAPEQGIAREKQLEPPHCVKSVLTKKNITWNGA